MLVAGILGCGDGDGARGPASSTGVPSSTALPSTAPATTTLPAGTDTTSAFGASSPYQPLWPFASRQQAEAWQQDYRSGGHQPWHLDAAQTALSFTNGFLGYTGIDRATTQTVGDVDAEVGVGFEIEPGRTLTAAVIHLVRLGTGTDAPWEVVGSADTDFTLTTPSYGASVTSPITVGGRITGVDESIRVQVRGPSSPATLGQTCCVPAGGEREPWEATVAFQGAADAVLTIAAATGGHVAQVERFTVTAVRV